MDEAVRGLLDELADHSGQHLVWQRDSLQRALQLFFRNADSFVGFLEDVEARVTNREATPLTDEYDDTFLVESHNYFSAAYGLFSKAQKFQSKWYCNCENSHCRPEYCDEFEPYLRNLRESGLAERGNYINSIRVMVQKIQTPRLLEPTKYNFFGLEPGTGVVIHRDELLRWVRRHDRTPAAEYLEGRNEPYLDLQTEVLRYNESVEKFYGWLFSDVREKYAHLLRDRRRFISEHTAEMRGSHAGSPE